MKISIVLIIPLGLGKYSRGRKEKKGWKGNHPKLAERLTRIKMANEPREMAVNKEGRKRENGGINLVGSLPNELK